MKKHSETPNDYNNLRAKVLGLGEKSHRKSYYPELQKQLKHLKRFHSLLDRTSDGILVFEMSTGNCVDSNLAASEITGFPSQLLRSMTIKDLLLNETQSLLQKLYRQQPVFTRGSRRISTEIRTRFDKNCPVEITLGLDSFDELNYAVIVFRDISDQLQTESALERSRKQLGQLIESAGQAILIIQHEHIVFCNTMAEIVLGYTEDELAEIPITDFIHLDYREQVMASYNHCLKDQLSVNNYAFQLIDRFHNLKWVEINAVYFLWNNIPSVLIFLSDITDRKRSNEEMKASESRFREIVEKSTDAIFVFQDNHMVNVNPRFTELFECTNEEVTSPEFSFMTLIAEESREELKVVFEYWKQNYTVKERVPLAFIGVTMNGEKKDLEINSSLIEWDSRPAVLGIVRDISMIRKLEAQLNQAQKMEAVGRLAGGIAHDFNNMLTGIIGHAELASMQLREDDPIYQDLKEIMETSERSANLVRQLLVFSRKHIIKPILINLNQTLENLNRMLVRIIGEDIQLQILADDNLHSIKADNSQVEQIIVNMAVNARDAMPQGGTLSFKTANVYVNQATLRPYGNLKEGDYVGLSIMDTGIGMPTEVISHIFEPFYTTKPEGKGTGLGLATVYGIIQQNNGFISVDSEVGKGTSFHIYLPASMEAVEVKEPSAGEKFSKFGNERVLVVEDDPSVRKTAVRSLERFGYNVIATKSGNDAYMMCKTMDEKVDLVLTDIVMPIMSGIELAGLLRGLWPDIVVLFMSGYTEDARLEEEIMSDKSNFLPKPFRPLELVHKVRELLETKE